MTKPIEKNDEVEDEDDLSIVQLKEIIKKKSTPVKVNKINTKKKGKKDPPVENLKKLSKNQKTKRLRKRGM